MMTVGWIIIGILAFYLLRNIVVGTIVYHGGILLVEIWNRHVPVFYKMKGGYRNYYLFILNPLLWRFTDVLKDKEEREMMQSAWKWFNKSLKEKTFNFD